MKCLNNAVNLYLSAPALESCKEATWLHFVRPNPQFVVTLGNAFSSLLRWRGCESHPGSFPLDVLSSLEAFSGYCGSILFCRAGDGIEEISCVVERSEQLSLVPRSSDAVGIQSNV